MQKGVEKSVAMIGRKEAILPFRALGVLTSEVLTPQEAVLALKQLKADGRAGVVYITEDITNGVEDEIRALGQDALPAVVVIPSFSSEAGESRGLQELSTIVQKAVGSDVLGADE